MEKSDKTYLGSLREGLAALLGKNDVFLIGEDVSETYGGAFKVTSGLAERFPGKVLNMPMSEQAFTGLGIGMSMADLKPIVEIMFGDFITLIMDQMLNHASKIVGGFGKSLHIVVRAPMGGYRGYGATHSQSLEKLFLGLPHIHIIAPSVLADPGLLLIKSLMLGEPVLFIENKLDYTRKMFVTEKRSENFILTNNLDRFPIQSLTIKNEKSEIAIITYGGIIAPIIDLIYEIYMEEEVPITLFSLTCLTNIDFEFLNNCVLNMKLFIIEEGHSPFGVGDGILANLYKCGFRGEAVVLGSKMQIIGASKILEEETLPNFNQIKKMILGK